MKQFVLPHRVVGPGTDLILGGRDFHYLVRVRRLRAGAPVLVCDCDNRQYQTVIGRVDYACRQVVLNVVAGGSDAVVEPDAADATTAAETLEIWLCQAVPKGAKIDGIIRQATELAVHVVVPMVSEYSQPVDAAAGSAKIERWRRICREARQQSGSRTPTAVAAVTPLDRLAALAAAVPLGHDFGQGDGVPTVAGTAPVPFTGWFCHQESVAEPVHGPVSDYAGRRGPRRLLVAIGPEGGFGGRDLQALVAQGFGALYFGPTVMRTETAGIYAVGWIRGRMAALE